MPDRYRVVAVTDTDTARRDACAAELGGTAHADIDALVADPGVELVVVATPNYLHAPCAVRALEAGRHVVCEKPFDLTVADVDAMIGAASASSARLGRPVVLSPFQNRRYEESFRVVRDVLRSGRIGRAVHIRMAYHGFGRRWDWQTLQKFGGGQLNNNAPHPLDQALELLADHGVSDPAQIDVWADLRNTLSSGDAEDHVRLTLRAPSVPDAPTIDIEFTAACPYAQDQWLVMATAGGLRGTGKELKWKWVDWSALPDRPVSEVSTPDRSYNREDLPWQEETHTCTDSFGDWPLAFYNDLYATLRQGTPLPITPEQVRKRIAIIEKARAAAASAGSA
jgi:predicted dehydrogenase